VWGEGAAGPRRSSTTSAAIRMSTATAAIATAVVGKLRAGTGSVNRGEDDGVGDSLMFEF